jgi:hypothetical protein
VTRACQVAVGKLMMSSVDVMGDGGLLRQGRTSAADDDVEAGRVTRVVWTQQLGH